MVKYLLAQEDPFPMSSQSGLKGTHDFAENLYWVKCPWGSLIINMIIKMWEGFEREEGDNVKTIFNLEVT